MAGLYRTLFGRRLQLGRVPAAPAMSHGEHHEALGVDAIDDAVLPIEHLADLIAAKFRNLPAPAGLLPKRPDLGE